MRNVLFILAAVALAAVVGILVRSQFDTDESSETQAVQDTEPAMATVEVIIADRLIEPGYFLREADLAVRRWPEDAVGDGFHQAANVELAELAGAIARERIEKGQPVTMDQIAKPGERGFLSAVLDPGTRAVSVPVTAASGVADMIYPGDRVDVVLTYQSLGNTAETAAQTVLSDIRVVAVGDRLAPASATR